MSEQNYAFEELKKALESKTQHLSEWKEKYEKIQADLDKYEVKNQELTKFLAAQEKKDIERQEKLISLERELSRIPSGKGPSESDKKIEMKKAFDIFLRKSKENKTSEDLALETKYLRTDNDPSGGYLCPPEYYEEILKKITEISPVRDYARILRTSRESLYIPVRETLLFGNWLGEGVSYQTQNSTYGLRQIKINTLSVTSVTTLQMLQDSVFNIEDQIAQDIAESFAYTEGQAFVVGDGINKPEGLLTNAGTVNGPQVFPSGIANAFDGDSLINIAGQLKTGYKPAYMANRRTLAFIRTLKDGIGQYLWTPGIANAYPSMINGYPYISAIDVPDIAVDSFPVIFADFFRGYTIADHINLYMIRDPYTLGAQGQVAFYALRRVGGMVTLAEAVKVLQCAV